MLCSATIREDQSLIQTPIGSKVILLVSSEFLFRPKSEMQPMPRQNCFTNAEHRGGRWCTDCVGAVQGYQSAIEMELKSSSRPTKVWCRSGPALMLKASARVCRRRLSRIPTCWRSAAGRAASLTMPGSSALVSNRLWRLLPQRPTGCASTSSPTADRPRRHRRHHRRQRESGVDALLSRRDLPERSRPGGEWRWRRRSPSAKQLVGRAGIGICRGGSSSGLSRNGKLRSMEPGHRWRWRTLCGSA